MLINLIVVSAVVYGVLVIFILSILGILNKALIAESRKRAFKEGAKFAKELGEFVLADSEGRGNERAHRARVAFEIELFLLSKANKKANK